MSSLEVCVPLSWRVFPNAPFCIFSTKPQPRTCDALLNIFRRGKIGEFYNIGSNKNLNNLQVTKELLYISSKTIKLGDNVKISFVKDRPGHDIRYALNSKKIKRDLKWKPKIRFNKGIKLTFEWYKNNKKYYNKTWVIMTQFGYL